MKFALIGSDAERIALRKHVESGIWPEYADHVEEMQMAIVLCAYGQANAAVQVKGDAHEASLLVAALDLEGFVYRRQLARWN